MYPSMFMKLKRLTFLIFGKKETPFAGKLRHHSSLFAPFLIVLALLSTAKATWADMIVDATEAMMGNQSSDMLLLGYVYGGDGNSPIDFTSVVASDGLSFSYMTQPGETYLGQPISINGMGTFDPGTNTWTNNTSWSLGSSSFTDSGIQKKTMMPDGSVNSVDDMDLFDKNGIKIGDIHFDRNWKKRPNSDIWDSTSTDYFTDKDGKKIPKSDTVDVDVFIPGKQTPNNWSVQDVPTFADSPFPFVLTSDGYSPGTGGDGNFRSTLVPEPETWAMLLMGLGFVGWAARRRVTA